VKGVQIVSFFFLNIFSAEVNPKQPKANKATDSTNIADGAVCSSLNEL
jgi:hypothetical protein